MRRALLVGVGTLALAALILLGSHPGRVAVKTALFVPQVVPAIPFKPQERLLPEPVVEKVTFPLPTGEEGKGVLYRPARPGRYGAVLLFLGVNPAGLDDPRVVNLGKALARSGVVALFPRSPVMEALRMEAGEVERVVGAFQFLQGLPFVDQRRVGMGGFCVGASFSLLAAADPRIRERVAFINAFGPYYNTADLLVQVASRQRFYGERARPWEVGDLTREVFTTHLIDSLPDPEERRLLGQVFVEGKPAEEVRLPALSPAGEAVRRLLSGVELAEARRLLGELPEEFRRLLEQVSPDRVIGQVKATVLIMHDAEDPLVPSEESRRLAEALQGRGRAYYTEFRLFEHMDPTRPVGLWTFVTEAWRLYWHLYRILSISA